MSAVLPERVVLPLGRALSVRWNSAEGQDILTVGVPGARIGLSEDEAELWSDAASGLSRADLIAGSSLDAPIGTYDALLGYGLIAEVATDPGVLLREASALVLLAHSRTDVHPIEGPIVGDLDGEYAVLSPAVHEIYGWAPATHSLAAAATLVANDASQAGLNDIDVIQPERLVQRAIAELLPLVRIGLASFGLVRVA